MIPLLAQTRFVRVGSRRLRYVVLGEGGPPALLVHGFGGDLDTWMLNRDALAQRCRVHALDLPGHGRSDKRLDTGALDEYVAVVAGFMDALALPAAHVVGHSMGGGIALRLAARAPQRVRSLFLLAPAGCGTAVAADWLESFAAARTRRALRPLLLQLFADPGFVSPEIVQLVLDYKRRAGVTEALARTVAAQFPGGRQRTLLRRSLGVRPTMVVWGDADRILPVRQARALPAGVAVRVLPGIGHVAHIEAADEVNRLLDGFIGAVESSLAPAATRRRST